MGPTKLANAPLLIFIILVVRGKNWRCYGPRIDSVPFAFSGASKQTYLLALGLSEARNDSFHIAKLSRLEKNISAAQLCIKPAQVLLNPGICADVAERRRHRA